VKDRFFEINIQRREPRIWYENYLSLRTNRNVLELARLELEKVYHKIRVLDIGCGGRPFEPLFENAFYVGTDISATNAMPDIVANNSMLPFKSAMFDFVILSETLEHTMDYEYAIKEVLRVTKPNGLIYISVPFMYPLHSWPYDYYRLTEFKLRTLFKEQELIKLRASNTLFSTWLIILQYTLTYTISAFPNRVRWIKYIIVTGINLIATALDTTLVKLILFLTKRTGLIDKFEKRINHPRGLIGFLESMPCGYALLVRKVFSG
jgi:SAM-dependent methyltransferase